MNKSQKQTLYPPDRIGRVCRKEFDVILTKFMDKSGRYEYGYELKIETDMN